MTYSSRRTIKAVRKAVVDAAEEAELLREKARVLAIKAKEKWEPQQEQLKRDLKIAREKVVMFSKDVEAGVKEGIAEVKKKRSR